MKSANSGRANKVLRILPTVMVLLTLGGIGYVGNKYGWKMPSASAILGGPGSTAEDWCEEHGVPESKCVLCHPGLSGGSTADWRDGHAAPDALVVLDPAAAVKDPLKCQIHTLKIQFASTEAVEKAGVRTQAAQERPMSETLEAYAEVEFDPTRLAKLSPRAPGVLWRIEKDLGQAVRKGEPVCLLESADAAKARMELLDAIATLESRSKAFERVRGSEGFRSQGELDESRAALRAAEIRLEAARQTLLNLGLSYRHEDLDGLDASRLAERVRLLGLPASVVESMDREASTSSLMPIISPFDGTVVARDLALGEGAEPGRTVWTVADLSRMTAVLSLSPAAAERLAPGQKVTFYPEGDSGEGAGGRLTWISTTVEDATRTVRAHAELDNSDGRLRAHTFGTARVVVRSRPNAVAVPQAAIHWEGCCHIAFVRTEERVFSVRKVRLGAVERGYTEILEGIAAGEPVAVEGSHVLKSELLRSGLGAGCCVDEAKK